MGGLAIARDIWALPEHKRALGYGFPLSPAAASSFGTITPSDSSDGSPAGAASVHDPAIALEPRRSALRPVRKFSPLQETSELQHLAPEQQRVQLPALRVKAWPAAVPAAAPTGSKEYARAAGCTRPIGIPGAQGPEELERQTSLIKAVPADTTRALRSSLTPALGKKPQGAAPAFVAKPPEGSWTKRQLSYPLNDPAQQPTGLHYNLKARNAAIKARVAKQASLAAGNIATADDLAWRFRMKKKWIREELYARRMDFPDDPAYEDDWTAAEGFVEACGPDATLQIAFLQGLAAESPSAAAAAAAAAGPDFESSDALLFPEEADDAPSLTDQKYKTPDGAAETAAKAAELVRWQRKALDGL